MTDKFNLKRYAESKNEDVGDDIIEHRLKEENKGNVEPEEINEKQLEDNRVGEPNTTLEGLLNQQRKASTDFVITERGLDTKEASFGSDFRNPSAYEGDIYKLEEKRLQNDPVEDEPYEAASETPKALRWWEQDKKDDLDIA
jgi:hypothetical protein